MQVHKNAMNFCLRKRRDQGLQTATQWRFAKIVMFFEIYSGRQMELHPVVRTSWRPNAAKGQITKSWHFVVPVHTSDDDELFLFSLLPYVKKIPKEQQLNFRTELMQCVSKWLEKNSWSDESLPWSCIFVFVISIKLQYCSMLCYLTYLCWHHSMRCCPKSGIFYLPTLSLPSHAYVHDSVVPLYVCQLLIHCLHTTICVAYMNVAYLIWLFWVSFCFVFCTLFFVFSPSVSSFFLHHMF